MTPIRFSGGTVKVMGPGQELGVRATLAGDGSELMNWGVGQSSVDAGAARGRPLLAFLLAAVATMALPAGAVSGQQEPAVQIRPEIPPEMLPPGSRYNEEPDVAGESLERVPPLKDEPAAATAEQGAVTVEELPQLVAGLGSARWAEREAAERRLVGMDASLLKSLDELLHRATDAEVLWRLERVYRQLVPQGEYAPAESVRAGFLGIGFEMISSEDLEGLGPRENAARVTMVVENSPAEDAGLQVDDLLVAVDGAALVGDFQMAHLQRLLVIRGAGRPVTLTVLRGGERREVKLSLAARPEEELPGGVVRSGPYDAEIVEYHWREYWGRRRGQGTTHTFSAAPSK